MKYFLDTEFLEGTQERPLLLKGRLGNLIIGYPQPTIDLISIGIISEDNRTYYAISKDFNLKEAWNRYDLVTKSYNIGFGWEQEHEAEKVYWIRENVLKPIMIELQVRYNKETGKTLDGWKYKDFKYLINKYGKTNNQIAKEIKSFVFDEIHVQKSDDKYVASCDPIKGDPEFYGYYSDYDWVVFCWIFGKMINLPKGFPKHCIDLKQTLDEKANSLTSFELSKLAHADTVTHNVYSTYDTGVLKCSKTDLLKNALNYPKCEKEHNALADAKWTKELYDFLQTL